MFFPDDAVRVSALSEYVDRWMSDSLLRRPPEETMTTATIVSPTLREPRLLGQTVVGSKQNCASAFMRSKRITRRLNHFKAVVTSKGDCNESRQSRRGSTESRAL
jgi:hypothetical protein